MGLERSSGVVPTGRVSQPGNGEELARPVKPFGITKRVVWDAYQHVKANQGAEGIDRQTIEMFEANLKDNLYRIWNRMCSGSYFPPAVRLVEIEGHRAWLGEVVSSGLLRLSPQQVCVAGG